MDWLPIIANIAQIVGVIWALMFGGKAIVDVIRGFKIRAPIHVNPLITLNIFVAAILVILLGMVVRPILIPLPGTSSHYNLSTLTPSPTATENTSTVSRTTVPGTDSHVAYNFEDGTTQGWDTTEGQYKLATLQVVSDPVRSGNHVLQVTTKLSGDTNSNNEVYRHTNAKVYFTQRIPAGFSNPPYNFQGKQVSCQVYLPRLLTSGSPSATVNISVKDISQRNDNGKPVPIDASIAGKWMQLSFVVGQYQGDADQGFDGTHIISIGVQVLVPPGSTLNYTGPFYIDNCILPH